MTSRRIASQQCTQVPHSATGDSRKGALWGCHSHGKAHFACGPHQRAHSACGRSHRVRLSVRARAQNALFRRMYFSLPAQTWSHLTQRRILRRRSHVKAQSATAVSRKGALWGLTLTEKRILHQRCHRDVTERRVLHASGGCAERSFSPVCVHSCVPTAARATGRGHGSHDIDGPMAPVMPERSDLRSMPPGR